MLTTKYTWIYRGAGALGCGLVLLGIFLPWATISAGGIGPFGAGDTPTGWDMAYSQKNIGSSINIAGAVFVGVFMMVLFAVIGLIVMLIGRDGASFSYFLISTSVFFLVFMLILLPYAQQSIPLPSGPSGGTDGLSGELNNTSSMVQQWKALKLNPLGGFYLSFAGAIMAYVGSRMIVSDTARIGNYRKFAAMLAQAHADGKVTTDEEALLAKEREILKISREEQIYIIRKTVPDPAMQERLIQMHDKPVDVEKILRTREFETYKKSLVRAYGPGTPSQEAQDMLKIQREGLSISEKDHDAMLDELIQSGQVVIAGSLSRARTDGAASPDGELFPQSPYLTPPTPPVSSMGPPLPPQTTASSARTSPPAPPATSSTARSASFPAPAPASTPPQSPSATPAPPSSSPSPSVPAAGPDSSPQIPVPMLYTPPVESARQSPPPSQPQSLLSGTVEPKKMVKCTRCGELIPITTDERPIQLICPKCGFSGMLRK